MRDICTWVLGNYGQLISQLVEAQSGDVDAIYLQN